MAYSSFCEGTLVGRRTPTSPTTPRLSCEGLAPKEPFALRSIYTLSRPWAPQSKYNTEEGKGKREKKKGRGGRRDRP